MHGRLKVKTTEQQQEEKRKEREKKLQFFRQANERVFQKRETNDYDEVLAITGQLLTANPDYYTLWSMRKELLCHFESSGDRELQKNFIEELHLTENCIVKNPKSYGAWHHRFWALQRMPSPDWKKEIKMCNTFLQSDERNFHCWNHRRKVCKLADTNPEEELKFTMSKIEANFSNYSAWHYRSSLLPLVYPGPCETKSIAEDKLLQEYDLVQSAAFTDPTDQSAWFYHRWLLGRVDQPRELLLLYASRQSNMVYVVLSKPLKLDEDSNLELRINDDIAARHWETSETSSATVWAHKLPESPESIIKVQALHRINDTDDVLECDIESSADNWVWRPNVREKLYRSERSEATTQILKQELESCEQLQELEPNNKWTMLTIVLLMRALNIQEYHGQILKYLEQLETADPLRLTYYKDLKSKCVVEHFLDALDLNCRTLCLQNQKLTRLPHANRLILMQEVNLSNNELFSTVPLMHLVCVKKLILDGNKIQECCGLDRLPNLEVLSMKNNNIKHLESLLTLKNCSKLAALFLEGNPCFDAYVAKNICQLILKL